MNIPTLPIDHVQFSPEYQSAVERYLQVEKTLGAHCPEAARALAAVFCLAPDCVGAEILAMFQEIGLMPEPSGYLEDGTPAFNMDDIAVHLEIDPDVAESMWHNSLEESCLSSVDVTINAPLIHRRQ